jgi:hypothetical protein
MLLSKNVMIRLPSLERDGVFSLLIIVGGGRQSAETHWRRARADYIAVFDNAAEISRLQREFGTRDNIAYFPLAEGETADTLARHGTPEMQALIWKRGSMNAASGLGQIPGVGFMAAEKLRTSDAFNRFLRQLRHEVGIRTNGRPRWIVARLTGSTAGGTATGAVETIAEAVADALKTQGVNFDLEMDLIDATTFLGLGDRCGRNSAATITELAAMCCSKGGNPLDGVTRSLSLMALPPFRHDAAQRYQLVALDEQAVTSSEMLSLLSLIRPNHSLDSPLGAIVYRQADFFRTLNPEIVVANEVAHACLPALEAGIESAVPIRSLLAGIFTDTTGTPEIRETIDGLLEDLPVLSDDDFLCGIQRAAEQLICRASAETANGERYDLERVGEEFLTPPASLSQAVRRLSMVRTIDRALQDEMSLVGDELQQLRAHHEESLKNLMKALTRVRRPRFWHVSSAQRRWQALEQAAYDLRAARDAMRPLEAILSALQRGLVSVQQEIKSQLQHLESTRDAMISFRPRGYSVPLRRSVEIREIDDAFPELSLMPRADRARQTWILASQVVFVTLDGLCRVLDLDEPRLDLIADRIVTGPPVYIGPYPGASRHSEGGRLVYCLPPMMPVPRAELKALLEKRMPDATVVFTDFAAAGINVMRYRFFRPQNVRELFPGMLERDLMDAIRDELKPLYFPHGDERLIELGIAIPTPAPTAMADAATTTNSDTEPDATSLTNPNTAPSLKTPDDDGQTTPPDAAADGI